MDHTDRAVICIGYVKICSIHSDPRRRIEPCGASDAVGRPREGNSSRDGGHGSGGNYHFTDCIVARIRYIEIRAIRADALRAEEGC